MSHALRHRCRNPHCRSRLPAPVENHHRAFCTRGCFEGFYLSRCRVCERDLRKTGKRGDAHRLYCRPPNDCRSEARKWPEKYPATWSDVVRVGFCTTKLTDPHEIEAKTRLEGERPRHWALRHWSWHSDECEHELRDADGTLLARIESNARWHRLTRPRTTPILSWPDLDEAKHHAEALALAAITSDLSARIKRDSEAPMGPPLNRPPLTGDATSSDWRPTGNGAGVPDIPDFLLREPKA
jgi:hypothetical protein